MNAGHHAPTNNSHSSLPSSFDDATQACAHGCSQYTHSSTTPLLSSRLAPGSPATYAQRQPIPATGPSNRAQARVLLFVSACAARSIAKHHTHTHTAVGWRYPGPESWKERIIQQELAGHKTNIPLPPYDTALESAAGYITRWEPALSAPLHLVNQPGLCES